MKNIFILVISLLASSAFAAEYMVPAGRVNFRSSADFSGTGNIIKVVREGQRMVATQDHGRYIEATLIPSGEKGFIWKAYLQLNNTHEVTAPPEEASTQQSQTTISPPMCGCGSCRRSSRYGMRTHPITGRRRLHAGCDMAAPSGQAVYAVADGRVKFAGTNDGYGKTIDLEHRTALRSLSGRTFRDGFTSRYAHLKRILVSSGQSVRKGQKIGLVNTTGASTGNHLHFEIAIKGTHIDPEGFFNPNDIKRSCGSNGQPAGTTTAQ